MELVVLALVGLVVWLAMASASLALAVAIAVAVLACRVIVRVEAAMRDSPVPRALGLPAYHVLAPVLPELAAVAIVASIGVLSAL